MKKFKEMDLAKAQADIEFRSDTAAGKTIKSMKNAKNLTATVELSDVKPVGDKILVSLKSWPRQSAGGLFMPDEYVVIRGEQYIAEVEDIGDKVTMVAKGDATVLSMYSGHHITTKTGHAKIVSESDIIIFKKEADMEKPLSFDPETFTPGINYILVKVFQKKTVRSEAGIITTVGDDDAFSKNDVVTKTGEVISIGNSNEYGRKYSQVTPGARIIFDSYVGIQMNPADVKSDDLYIVMLQTDILGVIA